MALTVVTSGTTAALTIGGPETTLSTQTPGTPTVYVVRLDAGPIANSELLQLLIYTKTLAGGTERLEEVYDYTWLGGGTSALRTMPCPTDVSFRAALLQSNGTGRAIPWKLFSL